MPARSKSPGGAGNGAARMAAVAASLARRDPEPDGWIATDMGCPDCRGVLCVREVGEHGWLTFRCRVGHAFSVESLLLSKENQLEESLWSTIEVLDEIEQLYGALSQLGSVGAAASLAGSASARLERARRHLRVLRRIAEREGPAAVPERRERRHVRR